MGNALSIDISGWQPENINWPLYKAWSAGGDGISRITIKVNEGTAGIDPVDRQHWTNALAAGIDEMTLYHFARPDLNPGAAGASAEARALLAVIGSGLRPHDRLMIDMEAAGLTPDWLYTLLATITSLAPSIVPGRIAIYANLNYIAHTLQDARLGAYPLILADWTYSADSRPAAPKPWSWIMQLQWTDRLTGVPGVPERVDADVFLHEPSFPVPNWAQIKTDLEAAMQPLKDAIAALGSQP